MFFVQVVIAIAVAASALASARKLLQTDGGDFALITEHPHQVSIEYAGRHICGGSIVTSRFVITALHCLADRNATADMVSIRAGTALLGQGGTVHQVDKIVCHDKYARRGPGLAPINDLAGLRIAGDGFKFDETRQPVKLFKAGDKLEDGDRAQLTGWGGENASQCASVQQLRMIELTVINSTFCNETYWKDFEGIGEGQVCALARVNKDSCQADGGAPLMVGGKLAGIFSWGKGCETSGWPDVFTGVAAFRAWIDEHLLTL
ncbi:hypothetical protein QAD02_023082 [Eretmocerus hayati]|uniref:Uncharacterized protein n=1 Tax=Eretmocerus hayati TaxID=131215 RepID=A0ACC2PVY6_9HYME|nr:hypothetical protein QAD02_023082 [Eretmocerus hayati]